jgi:phospholipase/carboxylesterase
MIDDEANVLSVRGNVLENGMPRFFRRLAEGIFDEEDLIFRTKELNEFLDEAAEKYDFDRDNILAIGYSNGANIAASLLFHYQHALKGAILHHPMVPRKGIDLPDLTGKSGTIICKYFAVLVKKTMILRNLKRNLAVNICILQKRRLL